MSAEKPYILSTVDAGGGLHKSCGTGETLRYENQGKR